MPINDTACIWELLPRHPFTIVRITQDVNNANPTMPHHNLAFNRQLSYHLTLLDIPLHSHNRRYRL